MQENNYGRIFWEKISQGEAKILRIMGQMPDVTVPDEIDGCPVVELGDYCFSQTAHLPEKEYLISSYFGQECRDDSQDRMITELCGSYLESISLPDSLVKIGNYAFYNCRNLKRLEFGNKLNMIGSDAFMNCCKLQRLDLRCNALEISGLQKILVQISWDVEVSFTGQCEPASLFYPEYLEAYDEIAPAHIFARRITGGGFSARQCFMNDKIDFSKYDAVFLQASNAESKQAICHVAICRLRDPVCLSSKAEMFYRNCILENVAVLVRHLVGQKALDTLDFLLQQQLLSKEAIQIAVLSASSAGWTEGCASMMRWQQKKSGQTVQERYSFE